MYARTTTFRGRASTVDDGITYVRDQVMPMIMGMSGCVGLSMLADRESGRCIVTSAWADEGSRDASAELVRESRVRGAEIFGAQAELDNWEIAIMHRLHDAPSGACARVTWMRGDPARADQMLDVYRREVIPAIEGWYHFCSISVMIDRADGVAVAAATYDSREGLEQSRGQAMALRDQVTAEMGSEVLEIAEFDVVLAHLRVPETV